MSSGGQLGALSTRVCVLYISGEGRKFTIRSRNAWRTENWRKARKRKRVSRHERTRREWTWRISRCTQRQRTHPHMQLTYTALSFCSDACLPPGAGEEEDGATASAGGDQAHQRRDHAGKGAEDRGGEAGWHESEGVSPKKAGHSPLFFVDKQATSCDTHLILTLFLTLAIH